MEGHAPHVARLEQAGWLGRRPGLQYAGAILGLVVLAGLCLAPSLTLMLIQLRAYHDPILSFFGLLQLLVAGTLLSLLALETYLERRQGAWLALSVLLYLACLLLYEASYLLFLLHSLLIWRR